MRTFRERESSRYRLGRPGKQATTSHIPGMAKPKSKSLPWQVIQPSALELHITVRQGPKEAQ
jgi:hypothetical protein